MLYYQRTSIVIPQLDLLQKISPIDVCCVRGVSMFHDGDLQSGIALALTEAKLVACFVTGALNTFV